MSRASAESGAIAGGDSRDAPLYRFESLASTNGTLKRLAMEDAPHGTMVVAQQQTGGRGRHGRKWHSPPGNFYGSILWKPARPLTQWPSLSLVAGLALHRTVTQYLQQSHSTSVSLRLKWPNDLLLDGAKLAGILLESATDSSVIVGIGVNIAHHPEDTPYPATSLHANGCYITADQLLKELRSFLAADYAIWQAMGMAGLRSAYQSCALPTGSRVQVRLPDEKVEGRIEAIAEDGSLILELQNGTLRTIRSGEVFPLDMKAGSAMPMPLSEVA